MSDLIKTPEILHSKECLNLTSKSTYQKLNLRIAHIGNNLTIRRALPHRDRKTIGAWCFLDHFGPLDLKTNGLRIAPHPHMGLQTFTYPLQGEILHRDSLGSHQVIKPNQVNLMTAGKGISHSEESLPDSILHGVQLWIALPDKVRHCEPQFNHYETIPSFCVDHIEIRVLAGEFENHISPVRIHSPLIGLALYVLEDTTIVLPLNPVFEYGILPLVGDIDIKQECIGTNTLLYLPCQQTALPIRAKKGSKILIIGGEPLKEDILIWWNFVARTKEEMIKAADLWKHHQHFGEVKGYEGDRLEPPPIA